MNPIFDVAVAIGWATTIGGVLAFVWRLVPGLSNRLVPVFAVVTTVLADVGLVWNKFIEALGPATAASLGFVPIGSEEISAAGIFGSIGGCLGMAIWQLLAQRLAGEKVFKPIFFGRSGSV